MYTKLAGVSFDGRQEVIRTLKEGDILNLIRDKNNVHDVNAVRVETQDGRQVGWSRAEIAQLAGPAMDKDLKYRCTIKQITGEYGVTNLGVNVFLEPDDMIKAASMAEQNTDKL